MKKKAMVFAFFGGIAVICLLIAVGIFRMKSEKEASTMESITETNLSIESSESTEVSKGSESVQETEGTAETSETLETNVAEEESKETQESSEDTADTGEESSEVGPEPSKEPVSTVEPTEAPTEVSRPTPEPTPEVTPELIPEPTPVPTPDPTPVPTPQPTPQPTPDPTPEPTPEVTPAPHTHAWTEYWWSYPTCAAHGDVTVYCALCNEVDESKTGRVEPLGHTIEGYVVDNGDCVSPSTTEYRCTVCGAENVLPHTLSSGPGDPDNHNWYTAKDQVWNEELFDFVEVEVTQCSRCNKKN